MPVHHGVQHGAAVMNRANSDEENVLLNPEERNHPGSVNFLPYSF